VPVFDRDLQEHRCRRGSLSPHARHGARVLGVLRRIVGGDEVPILIHPSEQSLISDDDSAGRFCDRPRIEQSRDCILLLAGNPGALPSGLETQYSRRTSAHIVGAV
jgi:hypothetical protein